MQSYANVVPNHGTCLDFFHSYWQSYNFLFIPHNDYGDFLWTMTYFLHHTSYSLFRLLFLPPCEKEDDSEDIDEEGGAEGDFLHTHAGKYPEEDERNH